MNTQTEFRFDGSDYVAELDQDRLTGQIKDIYNLMKDKEWRTLREIEDVTNHPQASISAQLRHLRKERFGCHTLNKKRTGEDKNGLFMYQLLD